MFSVLLLGLGVKAQRRVVGDIEGSKISQVVFIDFFYVFLQLNLHLNALFLNCLYLNLIHLKVANAGEYDFREKNRYRRPATYLILASKIVRPSTIYQVNSEDI